MKINKPRTRVVFFRLSEEEFESLEKACGALGARSISDFARTAAIRLIDSAGDGRELWKEKLAQIDAFLERLERWARTVEPGTAFGPGAHSGNGALAGGALGGGAEEQS